MEARRPALDHLFGSFRSNISGSEARAAGGQDQVQIIVVRPRRQGGGDHILLVRNHAIANHLRLQPLRKDLADQEPAPILSFPSRPPVA